MAKYSYIKEVLVALDQLGNASLAFGYADQTVSGRVGWHANYGSHKKMWEVPESIIDWAFLPMDGEGHCIQSIENDRSVADHTTLGLLAVTGLAVVFAVPIGVLLRLRAGFIWCRKRIIKEFD